jgi:hypothetical protein
VEMVILLDPSSVPHLLCSYDEGKFKASSLGADDFANTWLSQNHAVSLVETTTIHAVLTTVIHTTWRTEPFGIENP